MSSDDWDAVVKSVRYSDGTNVHLRGSGSPNAEGGYRPKKWPSYSVEIFNWGKTDKTVGTYSRYNEALVNWKIIAKAQKGRNKIVERL
jgi:hypothetical protein